MSLSYAVKIIPFFASPHLASLLDFYRTYLPDFTIHPHPTDAAEPTFASVWAGPGAAANIYIIQDEEKVLGSCMIMMKSVPALDELYEGLVAKGLKRLDVIEWTGMPVSADTSEPQTALGPIEDKSWGYRQFDLVDLHGNMIVFFAFLEGE
ncbi:hypothetical protein AYL99_07578 [Fonsecaea erecta]|uniref:Glyoxalase/fosfomycin resistance/dioxygenase domain-containing protein n=1 Tax=Fonsecaea erecta TaxID=1367422 RepID=A0A178ZFF1_9EURO|nr:hypothetical protein AYL99_07578 [Fonsecaea erecta]OAP58488.1 hypothetical protein AYL99_07578 [Fonsecaea erecta]